jgi:hypothetical protein
MAPVFCTDGTERILAIRDPRRAAFLHSHKKKKEMPAALFGSKSFFKLFL